MKTHLKTASILVASVIITGFIFFTACNRDPVAGPASPAAPANSASYSVHLTDSPGNYQEVNVNIVGVEIHSDVQGWVQLHVDSGVYDLLKLANGMDTLLAADTVIVGNVSQVRLILGDTGNTVEVNNVLYPLQTPSDQQSGLKINIHTNFVANTKYDILLDFNASTSVVQTGEVTYILKPVIKATVTPI